MIVQAKEITTTAPTKGPEVFYTQSVVYVCSQRWHDRDVVSLEATGEIGIYYCHRNMM